MSCRALLQNLVVVMLTTLLVMTSACSGRPDESEPLPPEREPLIESSPPAESEPTMEGGPSGGLEPVVEPGPVIAAIDIVPALDWRMEDRFGLDRNGNGRIDVPNSVEYVQNLPAWNPACLQSTVENPLFKVVFDAALSVAWASSSERDLPAVEPETPFAQITSYSWVLTLRSSGEQWSDSGASPLWEVCLPEGVYDALLTIEATDGTNTGSESVQAEVVIEDLLIVSIGDSYASGEGNPERRVDTDTVDRVYWADDGSPTADQVFDKVALTLCADCDLSYGPSLANLGGGTQQAEEHVRSHRSTFAAPAQVALALEKADPRTSVTFIFLAQSGAQIKVGVLEKYKGVLHWPPDQDDMESQIKQMTDLVGKRDVDALLLSAGGNDIGFSSIIQALIIREEGGDYLKFDAIENAVASGIWSEIEKNEDWRLEYFGPNLNWPRDGELAGLNGLHDRFESLDTAIRGAGIDPSRVYVTGYPNPLFTLRDGELTYCGDILTALANDREINRREVEWLDAEVMIPLNTKVFEAANEFGWNWITLRLDTALAHGICNGSPYGQNTGLYPSNPYNVGDSGPTDRWFRRARESTWIQGPYGNVTKTTGMAHPNEFGHQFVARRIVESLRLPVALPGGGRLDTE